MQDGKNSCDSDLTLLDELKLKCRSQTEHIMAWKKAYSIQVNTLLNNKLHCILKPQRNNLYFVDLSSFKSQQNSRALYNKLH